MSPQAFIRHIKFRAKFVGIKFQFITLQMAFNKHELGEYAVKKSIIIMMSSRETTACLKIQPSGSIPVMLVSVW